ncbi:MAG: SprT family zinc-dependent metalloprotease [Candidatus Cloacimonetes bacterium]|nr:SprT family zinc-dependent metalloprotease [Candidatus Cloacimonadota bacterium]
MNIPNNYQLIYRDIKHARIRVSEDGKVRVLIPSSFTDADTEALLKKKERWINQKIGFFAGKSKIHLNRNQLLLLGNRYTYSYLPKCTRRVILDNKHHMISTSKDMLDAIVQEKWYKYYAKDYLALRVSELSCKLNFSFNKLYIRSQRTKLGNCSDKKNISLNWRLIKAPALVIDYIIVHELVHTKVMNHTNSFWTLLKSHYPDYKSAIEWLDKYGNSL